MILGKLYRNLKGVFRLVWSHFDRIITVTENCFVVLAAVLLLVFISFICAGVIARYVFNYPLMGYNELATLSIGTIVYLGLAYTMRKGTHARIDLIINRFKGRLYHFIEALLLALSLLVIALLGIAGLDYVLLMKEVGEYTYVLNLKVWPFQVSIFLGCLLLCLRLLLILSHHVGCLLKGDNEPIPGEIIQSLVAPD
ncbi:TRAP transporter small permease [Chloroflexota bacterium]